MKLVLYWLARLAVLGMLFLLLFSEHFLQNASGAFGGVLREMQAVFRHPETQWMVAACFVIYIASFLFIRWRSDRASANIWLAVLVSLVVLSYTADYQDAAASLECLTLLGTIAAGQAAGFWDWQHRRPAPNRSGVSEKRRHLADVTASLRRSAEAPLRGASPAAFIAAGLIGWLTLASLWHPASETLSFLYHGRARWTGPWNNPNTFGVLMGAGVVLTCGFIVPLLKRFRSASRMKWIILPLLSGALGCLAVGLVHSYSRGAWLATTVGLVFLNLNIMQQSKQREQARTMDPSPAASAMRGEDPPQLSFFRKLCSLCLLLSRNLLFQVGRTPRLPDCPVPAETAQFAVPSGSPAKNLCSLCLLLFKSLLFPASVIAISLLALLVLNARRIDHPLARRVASVGNIDDFSWRNRVAAWKGALQMIAEKPLVGHGWRQPERLYEEYYKPAEITEGAAVQLNDYLNLAAAAGLPALLALVLCIASKLRHASTPPRASDGEAASMHPAFGATVLMLAVAFWFDGGLFKLPAAILFWLAFNLNRTFEAVP